LLWQTGIKDQFKLRIERTEYLVTGLHKKARKGLKISHPFRLLRIGTGLGGSRERLTLPEFETLQPGEKVYVLQRCGIG
jgi:hypothetical protein